SNGVGFALDDSACVWQVGVGLQPLSPSFTPQAELIRPDVTVLPGGSKAWAAASGTGSNNYAGYMLSAAPAAGGVDCSWNSRIQRLTRAGTVAPGWPAGGLSTGIAGAPGVRGDCDADGAGGIIVLARSFGSPAVQRIDAGAVRHAGWPAGGLVLETDP